MHARSLIVLAVLAGCSTQKATPPAEPPPPPNPCAGVLTKMSRDEMVVCGDVGQKNVAISIVDAAGASMGVVQAGAVIKIVDSPAIRREPDHVDQQVCVATGERAGTVGYVQNTRFFANSCN